MAPGGAHPRCALGWRRLGASSASAPRREPEQRCWVDVAALGQLDLAIGLSGTIRSRLRGRPAREGRLLSLRTPANRLGPETGPLAGVPACTRAGSPTLGASRRRPVHIRARVSCPGGQETFLAGPLRGHGFAWSGLVCCASRGGARGQPVVPLRPSAQASRARAGGSLQARACLAIAIPARGRRVSVETCCRSPVVVRPAHALAGRAGTVRRLPEEAAESGSCYRQGRTGKETQDESPARGIQFRQSAPLVPWPRGPGHRPRGSARGFRTNPEPDDRSAARHVAGGEPVSQVGSPKRTWFTEVNHDPPKRTVRARRSGTWWSAEADRLARRSGPVGHLPGDPSSAGLSAVQTDLNREVESRRLSDTVPEPIPRGL